MGYIDTRSTEVVNWKISIQRSSTPGVSLAYSALQILDITATFNRVNNNTAGVQDHRPENFIVITMKRYV